MNFFLEVYLSFCYTIFYLRLFFKPEPIIFTDKIDKNGKKKERHIPEKNKYGWFNSYGGKASLNFNILSFICASFEYREAFYRIVF